MLDKSIYDEEPFFTDFEEFLRFVENQLDLGLITLSDEFLEQQWDEDVWLVVGQIASISGVSTKAALYATLRAYIDSPEALTEDSVEEYLKEKRAGSN